MTQSERPGMASMARNLAKWLAVSLQLGSLWAFSQHRLGWFLAAHLISVVLASLSVPGRDSVSLFSVWSAALLPGLGAAALTLWTSTSGPSRFQGHLKVELPDNQDRSRRGRGTLQRESLRLEASLDASRHDVARVRSLHPDLLLKDKVERLKGILATPQSRAYHLAKSEWGKLQEGFTLRLAQLSAQLSAQVGKDRVASLRQLVLSEWEFAGSGLLETGMARFYQERARKRLLELQNLEPGRLEWRVMGLDFLLAMGSYSQAWEELRAALELFPDEADLHLRRLLLHYQACQRVTPPPVADLLNTAWELRQRPELSDHYDPTLREAARYWVEES